MRNTRLAPPNSRGVEHRTDVPVVQLLSTFASHAIPGHGREPCQETQPMQSLPLPTSGDHKAEVSGTVHAPSLSFARNVRSGPDVTSRLLLMRRDVPFSGCWNSKDVAIGGQLAWRASRNLSSDYRNKLVGYEVLTAIMPFLRDVFVWLCLASVSPVI